MKKKLILSMLVVIAMMCLFAISVSATAIDKETTVILNGSFTMGEESVTNPTVALYDEDGYALVWYLNTDNKLVSDRAVNLITVTNGKAKFSDVSKFYGGSQQKGVVVVNLRDDFVNDGLSAIETFDSNFQFGYYLAKKTVPIQYFYFPKTATEIIDRMFQETQVMIVDIEPGTPITRMGVHAVTTSNLKEFFVPKSVPSFAEWDNVGVFENTPLEKITFEEGSQIKIIPYRCFYMCKNLTELVLPNSVEEIHERAIQLETFGTNTKLKKLVLGASFKGFKGGTADNYYVRGTTNLKVYLPASFTAENVVLSSAHQYFTLCSNIEFYYSGTEEAWDALVTEYSKGKNGATGTSGDELMVSAKKNGRVTFDYNACDAFYNGVHTKDVEKSNACVAVCANCGNATVEHIVTENMQTSVAYENYSLPGAKTTICLNEGCTLYTAPVVEALDPLFTTQGCSVPENGNGALAIGYKVDAEALSLYTSLTGKTVEYGVFAVSQANLEGRNVFENGEAISGSITANITSYSFASFELKITGFEGDNVNKPLAMGAYVAVSDGSTTEYSYMQDDTKGDLIDGYYFVTYNQAIGAPSEE